MTDHGYGAPGRAADIAQLGFETAAAVIERVLELTKDATQLPLHSADGRDEERQRQLRKLQLGTTQLIEVYTEWTRALIDQAFDLLAQPPPRPAKALELGPVHAGTDTETTAWFHLLDGPTEGVAALAATPFTSHDGSVIDAGSLTFRPETIDTAHARTSHEVRVRAEVPDGTRAGMYYGHILARGLPEVSLPARVEVVDDPTPR